MSVQDNEPGAKKGLDHKPDKQSDSVKEKPQDKRPETFEKPASKTGEKNTTKPADQGKKHTQTLKTTPEVKNSKAKPTKLLAGFSLILAMIAVVFTAVLYYQQRKDTQKFEQKITELTQKNKVETFKGHVFKRLLSLEKQQALQAKFNDAEQRTLQNLSAQNREMKPYIDAQIAGVNANQAQNNQRLMQLQQSYLQPSSVLMQELQQLYKTAAINNLTLARNAWQILGSKTKTGFFLDQAKSSVLRLNGGSRWLVDIKTLETTVMNASSVNENLTRLSDLNDKVAALKLKPPLHVNQSEHQEPRAETPLYYAWQQVKSLIRIHKISEADAVLATQSARLKVEDLLYQNLQSLRRAVLNENNQQFAKAKASLSQLVSIYFIPDQRQQNWLKQLKRLTLSADNSLTVQFNRLITAIFKAQTQNSSLATLHAQKPVTDAKRHKDKMQ